MRGKLMEAGKPQSREHKRAYEISSVFTHLEKSKKSLERRNEPKGSQGLKICIKKSSAIEHD